jgi:hypothetical protein
MIWARMLAYITGTVDQELLLRKRISGRREPDPESPNQRQVVLDIAAVHGCGSVFIH